MLQEITYSPIFGVPLILFLGAFTLLGFILTGVIAVLNTRGNHTIPFVWHGRCAILSVCLGLVHGALGILAYL